MQSNIAIESSVQKHRENTVDEAVITLLTSRVDSFEYTFAGTQLDAVFGPLRDNDFINGTISTYLGKEILHKTYADLCADNLVSQLNVFGFRVNIFLEDYYQRLNDTVTQLLNDYLGEKYRFNLTMRWQPVLGLPFGGNLEIGPRPPQENTHVAKTKVSLPETTLSDWIEYAETFVHDTMQNLTTEWNNLTGALQEWNVTGNDSIITENLSFLSENLTMLINKTIDGIIFDGFHIAGKNHTGVLNATIKYVFGKINDSLGPLLDGAWDRINQFTAPFDTNFSLIGNPLDLLLNSTICDNLSLVLKDYDGDGKPLDLDDLLTGLQLFVVSQAKTLLHSFLDTYIAQVVDQVMILITNLVTQFMDGAYDVVDSFGMDGMQEVILQKLTPQFNVLRADLSLTLWEVRT